MFIALGSAIAYGPVLLFGSASAIQLAALRAACLRYWRRGSVHGDARNGRTSPWRTWFPVFSLNTRLLLGRWAGFRPLDLTPRNGVVAIADVTAFAVYMKFCSRTASWIWIVSVLLILLAINLAKVKA